MGFLRPKSRGNGDDVEQKKRNRLSKPMTNKSQTNLKAAAKQQLGEQEEIKSRSQLALDEIVNNPNKEDSRAKARSHLFDLERDGQILSPTNTQSVKSGVAKLVAQYDTSHPGASPSQLSVNSHGKVVPEPIITRTSQLSLSRKSGPNYASGSLDYRSPVQSPTASTATTTPHSTSQQEAELYRVPTRRRSNFLPGEATRKSSSPGKSPGTIEEDLQVKAQDDAPSPTEAEKFEKSGYWTPPTSFQLQRSETPHSTFEHKALGNLSLGSLHIVNGRASPAFTEVSLRPKGFPVSSKARDISSEYGDSEAWEDEVVAEEESDADSVGRQTPTNDLHRNFSFTEGAEKHLTPDIVPTTAVKPHQEQPTTPARRPPSTASILAEEYMAELPTSPYSAEGPISSPLGSTGSVVHHRLEDDIEDFRSFNDGPLHYSPRSQSRKVSNESHGSSVDSKPSETASKLSSVDSRFAQDEVFQSALEFQQQEPMLSPANRRPAFRSNPTTQSDSGYSSNTSVWSLQSREQIPQNQQAFHRTIETPGKDTNPRKLGSFLPSRPAMKRADTESTIPTSTPPVSQGLVESGPYESSPVPEKLAQTISSSPTTPTKQRKKLQKARPFSTIVSRKAPPPPNEVVVQRNTSVESYSVPAVSPDVTASLRERAEQLPELEHTVENHTKKSDSTSTLTVPEDIRFPTPNPEPVDNGRKPRARSRSKSRARSKSRRRSMLEFFTGNKEDKRKSVASQMEPEVNIDDLGDVVAALGSNPYDIAYNGRRVRSHSRPVSHDGRRGPDNTEMHVARQIVPYKVSYQHGGPRLMMDAQTASQYARTRSRSIHERDNWGERPLSPVPTTALDMPFRRTSFNDRGGIPGKSLRTDSFSADAPPMPTMPSPADIRRMSAKYDERNSDHSHRTYCAKDTEPNTETCPEAEDDPPPPPPPPHSPRPSFMDEDEFATDDREDWSIAPPPLPPSHSPRPMDIHPNPDWIAEDVWAAQARAWKDRRRSAGEALRARYESQGYSYFDPYQQGEGNNDLMNNQYPRIPSRQTRPEYFDGSENWPPQLQRSQTWDGEYGNDYHSYSDHSRNHEQFDLDDQDHNGYNYEYTTSFRGRKPVHYQDHNYTPHRAFEHYSHDEKRTTYEDQARYDVPYNRAASPVPSGLSESRPLPSRPSSRVSYRSNVSGISLAEELHPELMHDKRPSPAPEFGRYSGGLQYSYEGREKGFGGSSGTRSVSGKADAHWKGAELKQGWGVDLGDVPIMGVVRPVQ